MPNDELFRGRHVMVTGGSMGIGFAIADAVAARGAQITLVARRREVLREAQTALRSRHANARVELVAADVADANSIDAFVAPHVASNPVDVLVNSAGIARPGTFVQTSREEFRSQMEVNYFGTVEMCRVVVPEMIARHRGYVVNVGSMSSVFGVYGYTAYTATKFAVLGFSECLRAELKPHGIDTTVLLPPVTDTEMYRGELSIMPEETKAIIGTVQTRQPGFVAEALLRGMAERAFLVVPGVDSQLTATANRWFPGATRAFLDWRQRRAKSNRPGVP